MNIFDLDTPTLMIDREILTGNIMRMQQFAELKGVSLRPHTKTHKMPKLAKIQIQAGAVGITVAKVGEAEVMASNGIKDIFIANEIVGESKLKRIRQLAEQINISFGIDSVNEIDRINQCFEGAKETAKVLVEIEVGEKRSGVTTEREFIEILKKLKTSTNVRFKGIFSHDGHTYQASTLKDCCEMSLEAQRRTLHFGEIAKANQMQAEVISIGSTPPFLAACDILPGITEIRPGTYALMDASQSQIDGNLDHCAATILATVMSKPTCERVVLDVGAKGLTKEKRTEGICAVSGMGSLMDYPGVHIHEMYDEHAIIYNEAFNKSVEIGDKVRIVPVHICPVCNLYDEAVLISQQEVIEELSIQCRGMLK